MKHLKILSILLTLLIYCVSCSKDEEDNNSDFDGSIESIENFYTPELLDALDDLVFTIHEGDTPPNIEGTYLVNPLTLSKSNIAADVLGTVYSDFEMTFANQSNSDLSLDFQGLAGNSTIESVESYVSGSGNNFSVFLKVESTSEGHTSILAYAFSGTLASEGILNYQFILIMLDDRGDLNDTLIENNTGRLFVDGDELCSKISSDSRSSGLNSNNKLFSPNTSQNLHK